MRPLWNFADFGRAVRRQLRFGNISRAPIRLLRLGWQANVVECDWMVRAADPWDADLPRHVSEENASAQALEDAIAIQELIFAELPEAEKANLRAFRQVAGERPELIIAGNVDRGEKIPRHIVSPAMRAKLLGFRFWFVDGSLAALESEECAISF